jgi:hypothetical protein
VRAPPSESVHYDEKTNSRVSLSIRSESERGLGWAESAEVDRALEKLRALANTNENTNVGFREETNRVPAQVISEPNLPNVWPRLCVRVMSGRNHDFGTAMMNKFYTQEVSSTCDESLSTRIDRSNVVLQMKDFAAAEHTVHAKLAFNGKRIIYPKTTHNKMFLMTPEVADMVDEVAQAVQQAKQQISA